LQVCGSSPPTAAHLKDLKFVQNCISEAIRLNSPGIIIRKTTKEITINKKMEGKDYSVVLPANHELCICMKLAHRDPEIYQNPDEFYPERFYPEFATPLSQKLRYSFFPFGAGTWSCPGRSFAWLEMTLCIAMLFQRFDLSLENGAQLPPIMEEKIVGVSHPKKKLRVFYKIRNHEKINTK
jgi:cytochrome P450